MQAPNAVSLSIVAAVLIGLQTFLNGGTLVDQWWLPAAVALVGTAIKAVQELMYARAADAQTPPPGVAAIGAPQAEKKSVFKSVLVG